MSIVFITGNAGKFKDAQLVFGRNVTNMSIDLDEIQSMDPEEVIRHKLKQIKEHSGSKISHILMVEDTSLFIDCLGGLPGTFVKFFVERLGPEGIYNQVSMNCSSMATAVSCVGIYDPDVDKEYFFKYEMKGKIVSPKGVGGFGWDSIFCPEGSDETYAEMDSDTRSMFNMRILAMKKFLIECN